MRLERPKNAVIPAISHISSSLKPYSDKYSKSSSEIDFESSVTFNANLSMAFWRSDILNYKPFETWQEEGEKDLTFEASKRAKQLLKNYELPDIDISKKDELSVFVLKKKNSMPDAFV